MLILNVECLFCFGLVFEASCGPWDSYQWNKTWHFSLLAHFTILRLQDLMKLVLGSSALSGPSWLLILMGAKFDNNLVQGFCLSALFT